MSDIFQEVEDDLHNERLEKLWKKYGSAIITFAVGIVVGTALYVGVDSYLTAKYEAQTEKLVILAQAVTEGDTTKLDEMVSYASDVGGDNGAMALLKAGEKFREDGQNDKALNAYKQISEMSGADDFYNDLGALMVVQMQLDILSAEQIEEQLSPLAAEGRPLRYTAKELMAYTMMNKGDYQSAAATFKELANDANAPLALQQRASALANIAPAAGEEKDQ